MNGRRSSLVVHYRPIKFFALDGFSSTILKFSREKVRHTLDISFIIYLRKRSASRLFHTYQKLLLRVCVKKRLGNLFFKYQFPFLITMMFKTLRCPGCPIFGVGTLRHYEYFHQASAVIGQW